MAYFSNQKKGWRLDDGTVDDYKAACLFLNEGGWACQELHFENSQDRAYPGPTICDGNEYDSSSYTKYTYSTDGC